MHDTRQESENKFSRTDLSKLLRKGLSLIFLIGSDMQSVLHRIRKYPEL